MQRIVLREDSYVLQNRYLWWWEDTTAQDGKGNDLPCYYIFDTLEEIFEVSDKDVMITKEVFEHNVELKPQQEWIPVEDYINNFN